MFCFFFLLTTDETVSDLPTYSDDSEMEVSEARTTISRGQVRVRGTNQTGRGNRCRRDRGDERGVRDRAQGQGSQSTLQPGKQNYNIMHRQKLDQINNYHIGDPGLVYTPSESEDDDEVTGMATGKAASRRGHARGRGRGRGRGRAREPQAYRWTEIATGTIIE